MEHVKLKIIPEASSPSVMPSVVLSVKNTLFGFIILISSSAFCADSERTCKADSDCVVVQKPCSGSESYNTISAPKYIKLYNGASIANCAFVAREMTTYEAVCKKGSCEVQAIVLDFDKPRTLFAVSPEKLKNAVEVELSKKCTSTLKVNENAIYSAAYLGLTDKISEIQRLRDCLAKRKDLELFCEYYCSYDFAFKYLSILAGKEKAPTLNPKDWGVFPENKTVADYEHIFKSFPEPELIEIGSSKERINAEAKKLKMMPVVYEFTLFYELSLRPPTSATKVFLFKRLMEVAGRDASGDGGVNQIQAVLYHYADHEKRK